MVLTEFHGSVECTWCHWGPHEGLAEGPPGGSSTPPWWWPPGRADYLCHWAGGSGPSPPYCPTPPGYASASEHTQSDIYVEKYGDYTLIQFTCVFYLFYQYFLHMISVTGHWNSQWQKKQQLLRYLSIRLTWLKQYSSLSLTLSSMEQLLQKSVQDIRSENWH